MSLVFSNRPTRPGAALLAPVLALVFALIAASCGSDDGDAVPVDAGETADSTDADSTDADSTEADAESTEAEAESTEPEAEDESDAAATGVECPPVEGAAERIVQFPEAPPMCIDVSANYQAVFTTNRGTFTVDLDPSVSPQTVNNFVFLARNRYYDGVVFHRIIPGFVVQGGDAVGEPLGTGGPGYVFPDELDFPGYEIGSVAMANAGPNTNGSQFFIVTGDQGAQLPAQYSLFGSVTDGMDIVMAIEGTGTQSGEPSEPTVMESVVIIES